MNLGIFAHQDDTEFAALHGIARGKFSAVIVTDGAGSPKAGRFKNHTDAELVAVRKQEQIRAAKIGKYVDCHQLGYSSSVVKDKTSNAVTNDILKILSKSKTEIVYTHNLADKHATHVAVALKTIQAIRQMPKDKRPKKLLGCEVWRSLDWLDDNDKVILNTSTAQQLGKDLLNVFESQIEWFGNNFVNAGLGRQLSNATFLNSHNIDDLTHVTFAMDLTPLIQNESLDIKEFVLSHIDSFKKSVLVNL